MPHKSPQTPSPTPNLPANRRPPRHNEWTREKMATFLRELAATQSVALAAKAVGMSRTSAYNLRNRLQNTPFALGWEVALECGMHQLAHAVMERALNGVEVEHYYHGELVATTRAYDNNLARWVLENPWKVGRFQVLREYASGNLDALLERIEAGKLDWEEGDTVPGGAVLPVPGESSEARVMRFVREESWYADSLPEPGSAKRGRAGKPGGW